ncbi:MAG: hypothetical protein RI947_214 [Candidatus Parcubacteria bacterium]|jgi:hypothetical protein
MKRSTAKIYLGGIGIISLAFFFWIFLYQMFINTNAESNGIHAYFDKSRIVVGKESYVDVNLYLLSRLSEHISGGTIVLKYPSHMMRFISTLNEPNSNLDNKTQKECIANKYRLTKVLKVVDDPTTGMLTISRVALTNSDDLASGLMCFGTLSFVINKSTQFGTEGLIQFANTDKWDFVGPEGTYKLFEQGRNSVLIRVANPGELRKNK